MHTLGFQLRPPLLALSALLAMATTAAALLTEPDAAALVADAARAVAGDRAVADLEDVVYGARDWLDRARHDGDKPQAHWASPARPATVGPTVGQPARETASAEPAWNPRDVGPMFDDFAAEGDGVWVPVRTQGDTTPIMKKTLLHPDRTRAFAELFVVAIDLWATTLHYVAGTEEPESAAPGALHYARQSKVPAQHRDVLLAAFNGGFKTRHGRHGVAIDGTTLVPFRAGLCTLVGQSDGSILLARFEKMAPLDEARSAFVRQTARCLVEDGERHPALVRELTASWGAAVGGDTVIRRSAVGMSADRRTLFVGVSNRTTATALADGMRHAGASTAAQLDVNEAFPRFLTYHDNDDGELVAESVAPGFIHRKGHYVSAPSSRDFFYITRKVAPLAVRDNGSPEAG